MHEISFIICEWVFFFHSSVVSLCSTFEFLFNRLFFSRWDQTSLCTCRILWYFCVGTNVRRKNENEREKSTKTFDDYFEFVYIVQTITSSFFYKIELFWMLTNRILNVNCTFFRRITNKKRWKLIYIWRRKIKWTVEHFKMKRS